MNGKVYIGQSIDLDRRKKDHIRNLNKNVGHNSHFQNAWNKYGENNFEFEVIHLVENSNELNYLETYYIEKYDSTNPNKGYNFTHGGDNPSVSELYRNELRMKARGKNTNLSIEDVRRIKLSLYCLMDRSEISAMFNIKKKTITPISNGNNFNYINPELNDKIYNLKQTLIEERNSNILKLYDDGKGVSEICKLTELSVSIVEKCIYKNRDAVNTKRKKYQQVYDEVHKLYNEGYKKYHISKILKISPSTVDRYLTNYSNPYKELNYKKVTKDIEYKIIELYFKELRSVKEIAGLFCVSENTIRDYISRYKNVNTEVS